MTDFDVIIIGAGAAGLFCAAKAGQRGRRVWLVDHAKKIGEKIRISGGGRCNFTNINTTSKNFLSQNPHFCKSALSRFTPQDFISLVDRYNITWHEKTLGQLFCDKSSQQIIDMLVKECDVGGVQIQMETTVNSVKTDADGHYIVQTEDKEISASSLVIATGGLSIPKIGASKFGYDIAKQFGVGVLGTRAGLVPLTFQAELLESCKEKSGLSVEASVSSKCGTSFAEGLLFTHRGLSGPSILQISSYWNEKEDIEIDLAYGVNVFEFLKEQKTQKAKQDIHTVLSSIVPKRLAADICEEMKVRGKIAELSDKHLNEMAMRINKWNVRPSGTEGYRTAEVTLGGVDTACLSSKSMEVKEQPGLYFIGEVVDVTGHLGGFNFQWAWASANAAGEYV